MCIIRSKMAVVLVCIGIAACQTAVERKTEKGRSSEVAAAYLFYSGSPGSRPAPTLAENTLRMFVLGVSEPEIEKNCKWVTRSDWRQNFKDLFAQVILWKRETLGKGAAHVYRLSGQYRKRPDARENHFDSLSYNLLQLAAEMGHVEAQAELPLRRHPMDEPDVLAKNWAREYSEAVNGDWRAQIYLAQEYLMGRFSRYHVSRDPMKAYYWYLRAKPNAGKYLRHISNVPHRLSSAERARVEQWLAKGIVPEP